MFWWNHCLNKFKKQKKGQWENPNLTSQTKKKSQTVAKKKTRDQLSALAELILKLQTNRPELWHAIF